MIIFEDTFDKNNFDEEKKELTLILDKELLIKKSILKYMDKLANSALSSFDSTNPNIAYDYLLNIKSCLDRVDLNIDKTNELINFCTSFKNIEFNCFASYVIKYNKLFKTNMKIICENDLEIQKLIFDLTNYFSFDFSSLNKETLNQNSKNEPKNTDNFEEITKDTKSIDESKDKLATSNNTSSISINIEDSKEKNITSNITIDKDIPCTIEDENKKEKQNEKSNLKENILFISEIQKKVILPYTIKELDEILNNSDKYTSYKELIDSNYTIPISYYKFSSTSRFKEAYNLIKKRSNGTTREAFDLGIELFFKYDLNPAIITACKNIDELDIYLACLDDNDLNSFKCFEIVFEGLPTLIKK